MILFKVDSGVSIEEKSCLRRRPVENAEGTLSWQIFRSIRQVAAQ